MTSTDDAPGIEWIKEKIKASDYNISEHIIRDFLSKKATIREIEDAIATGRIIEIHRHPEKGTSALLLGYAGKKPIHVMCADDQHDRLLILFAYVPSRPMWEDPVNRVKHGGKRMGENLNKCFFCGGKIKQIKMGNFDYRLEGKLYVVKDIPAGLCVQCGEKYITAQASKKINRLIEEGRFGGTEEVFVLQYE
ncbi:MAG: YgiT-type zinc finger protein [Deltaproteobacteria bacterium]|nr:YgiT-type zinc finger protein [Deltaproteobacteria bacterium]